MNKLKKIPFFLIFVSVIYVILEIMFRSNLLEVTATIQDNSEIIKLENVGRFLASLGFAIFITSLIKIKKEYRNRTKFIIFISYPIIFLLSFYSFSQAQKHLIEYVAQNVSTQMKREMLLTSLVKEAIYFEKINIKPIYSPETKNDIDSKVFLSFFPAIIVGSDLTKKYEPQIKNLVDITLTEKIIKNKDDSNKEIENFIKKYLESYRYSLDTMTYGIEANYTGFKQKETKAMLNYVSRYMSFHASFVHDHKPKDYFTRKSDNFYESDITNLIARALSGVYKGYDFNDIFNEDLETGMGFKFLLDDQYLRAVDAQFYTLKKADDYKSLLKYYNFGFDIKQQCTIKKSDKNTLIFKKGYAKSNSIEHLMIINNDKERFEKIFNNFYSQLTDRIQKEPSEIICDYSYEPYLKLLNRTERYFKSVSPLYNKDKFSIRTLNTNTVNSNIYFKRMALNVMFDFIYENTGKNIITKFKDFQDFENFRNSIIFTEKGFHSSMNKYMFSKYLKEFNRRSMEDNLNFNNLLKLGINFGAPASFDKAEVVNTFKRGMPFIVNKENKFFKSMNELTEKQKHDLRLYYVEHKKKIYNDILSDTNLLSEGEKYEEIGNNIAKGFIAPIFVLSISNIMIILSIINIFIKIVEVYEIKHIKIVKLILIISLISVPYFMKNRYSENELFYKYPNKTILNLVNWTQNTENVLHRFDNNIIVFESIYYFIETITKEKEKRR